MIQTDRSWITDPDPDHPKECSLIQENIVSHLAKSDGNTRILIVTIAMRVYSQGVNPLTPASNCPRPSPDFLAFFGNISERAKAKK